VSLTKEVAVGVWLLAHLKRPGIGKAFEEGRAVRLADLRGSSMIEALSDSVLAIERNQMSEDPLEKQMTTVRQLKCRLTGETGFAGLLTWDADTGRLLPDLEGGADYDG